MFVALIEHEYEHEVTGNRAFTDHVYGPFSSERAAWDWLIARGNVDSDSAHDVLPVKSPYA